MLLGQPTKGDPLVREALPLGSGEHLYIVTRRLVVADGTAYSGHQGVRPDIAVAARDLPREQYEPEPTDDEPTEEEQQDRLLRERVKGDAVLTRAVDVLLGLKALNIGTFGKPTDSTR